MPGTLSCREPVYPSWQDAVELLPEAGIRGLEANQRPRAELAEVVAGAQEHGVEVMTLATHVNLDAEESVTSYLTALDAAAALDIPIVFTSASGSERGVDDYMSELGDLGDEAQERGVVMSLETHPPFCQNADRMLETMDAVAHPNVGVNFDTANIYYYNRDLTSAQELERVVEHVVSLHLKDTDGTYQSFDFPVLGRGVVELERIFATLDAAGFDGPLTLELEGPVVHGKDRDERHNAVLDCVQFLRSVGVA
ncbi:MAG: sugar phosphate isomerase/epimerase family protein [Armatimonadota bacterium]